MARAYRLFGVFVALAIMAGGASAAEHKYRLRKCMGENGCALFSGGGSGSSSGGGTAPSGYTVAFDQPVADPGNQTAISFTISGAQVGATYDYAIDDTNPGTPAVAAGGSIVSVTQQVSGLDVSSLDDGMLTLTLTLADGGMTGAEATDLLDKDTVAPGVSTLLPADNATTGFAKTANLVITFDENVAKGSGNIMLYGASGALETIPVSDAKVSVSGAVATINPGTDFVGGTATAPVAYHVMVDPGAFEDVLGNPHAGIATDTAWNFSLPAGKVMPDGTVYAGLVSGVAYYAAHCDYGMTWDGSICTGTRSTRTWSQAGTYCSGLVAHGRSDWSLGTEPQMQVVYANRMAIGDFRTDNTWGIGYYWTATTSPAGAWSMRFGAYHKYDTATSNPMSVRCLRTGGAALLAMATTQGDPAAMDIAGGSSPGSDVVLGITNTGGQASGAMAVSLTGDAANFSKTADTCDGQILAAGDTCSITVQPVATADGSYTGTLQVAGTPGGTVSQALSGTASGFVLPDPCAGSPAAGDVCDDGTVYAGLTPDGNVPMYVTRCDAGMNWDGAACTGTRSAIVWNNGSINWTTTGIISATIGEANTTALAVLSDAGQPYEAARYCDNLSMHAKTDWYLPARAEWNVIYLASVAAGGTFRSGFDLSGSHPSGYYWSSSENADFLAWYQRFSDGHQDAYYKNSGLSVRCARKEGAALGMGVQQGDPSAVNITGGSSPGSNVVFTITNTGEAASGAMTVSLTGDTANFSKTVDTCNGQTLASLDTCSITIQPIATDNGSYTGTLQVSGTPGGTVSRGLSGTAEGFGGPLGSGTACAAILIANPASVNGIYTLTVSGASFDVYCDMTGSLSGGTGGWMLLARDTGAAYDMPQPTTVNNRWEGDLAQMQGFLSTTQASLVGLGTTTVRAKYDGGAWVQEAGMGTSTDGFGTPYAYWGSGYPWRYYYYAVHEGSPLAGAYLNGGGTCRFLATRIYSINSYPGCILQGTAGAGDANATGCWGCSGQYGPVSYEIWVK